MRIYIFSLLLCCSLLLNGENVHLTIFHISDSSLFESENFEAFLEQERNKADYSLTTLCSNFKKSLKDLKKSEIDFALLSKKDLFEPLHSLKTKIQEVSFPFLASNLIDLKKKPFTNEPECFIYEIGKIKVGFLGLVSFDFRAISEENEGAYFLPYQYVVKEKIKKLKERGCNFIILFSDLSLLEEKEIARSFFEIDLIIGRSEQCSFSFFENDTLIYKTENSIDRIDLYIDYKQTASEESLYLYPTWRKMNLSE